MAAERSRGVALRVGRFGCSERDAVRLLPLPFGDRAVGLSQLQASGDPTAASEASLSHVRPRKKAAEPLGADHVFTVPAPLPVVASAHHRLVLLGVEGR